MYDISKEHQLASNYISTLRSLGPKSYMAHNPRDEGILHYFVKKKVDIKIIEEMIEIINNMYENALLEDLEKVSTEQEDVFTELEKQGNKELKKIFEEIKDTLINESDYVMI